MKINKETSDYKDYLIQVIILLSQHSFALGCEPDKLKITRKKHIFAIFDFLKERLSEKAFKNLVFDQTTLYTWSTRELSPQSNWVVSGSKTDSFKSHVDPNRNYKYHYEIKIKKDSYAIDINKIIDMLSKNECKKIKGILYGTNDPNLCHSAENEVLYRMRDVDEIKLID